MEDVAEKISALDAAIEEKKDLSAKLELCEAKIKAMSSELLKREEALSGQRFVVRWNPGKPGSEINEKEADVLLKGTDYYNVVFPLARAFNKGAFTGLMRDDKAFGAIAKTAVKDVPANGRFVFEVKK